MKKLLLKVHGKVLAVCDKLAPLAGLVLRLAVAGVFIQSGWGKLNDLFTVTVYFRSLGIPFPEIQAPFIAGLEFVGGIALLAGIATRYFSFLLMSTMAVAMITAKWKSVATENTPKSEFLDIFGWEEFHYFMIFLALIILGAGAWSLDQLIKKKMTPDAK